VVSLDHLATLIYSSLHGIEERMWVLWAISLPGATASTSSFDLDPMSGHLRTKRPADA
jgi:hypothetical protein